MSAIESLYKSFGILADAEDKNISQHTAEYQGIINATKGSNSEKKLAPSFITKFFRHFPSLHDAATDAILDLIEDEDPQIRRLAIKSLPDICKGASDDGLYVKVSDVLTQLLPIEDTTDLEFVKTGMATVLQMNTKLALVGIFDQIMGEDETIREKGLEYVTGPLISMRHKLFINRPENEKFLLQLIKKVLVDVTGKEFEDLMELLSKLTYVSTPEGSQELMTLISEQAELVTEFKPDDTEFIDKFITCFRQALKFSKCGSTAVPFITYLCVHVLPGLSQVKEDSTRQEMLQLLAEACLYPVGSDVAESCIQPSFDCLLEYLPVPPDAGEEQPKLQFSIVECVLFVFHTMCKHTPEFIASEENATRLKDLRRRLQYFSRGSQAYHGQLSTAIKGRTATDVKDEQTKLRTIALKTTANVNALIKDFFHNPPSYKTGIVLSWGAKKQESSARPRKRTSAEPDTAAKRKPSPIRFEASAKESIKREAATIYSPPKDKFSKQFANGSNFESYVAARGGSGRGGGGGSRRGGRGKRGKASWRV